MHLLVLIKEWENNWKINLTQQQNCTHMCVYIYIYTYMYIYIYMLAVLDHFTLCVDTVKFVTLVYLRPLVINTISVFTVCMTLWCRVSERSFDLFSVISVSLLCLSVVFSLLSLSLCLITCPSNIVFATGIEDNFSHGCIFRCFGFATIWLLRKLQIRTQPLSSNVRIWCTVYSESRCVGDAKSVPGRWVATFISEVPPNLSQYIFRQLCHISGVQERERETEFGPSKYMIRKAKNM
jgi:hypothetical protein